MKPLLSLTAAAMLLAAPAARALEFNTLQLLTQEEFRRLSEDLASAGSSKTLAPAAPLGITGFDIGITGSFVSLESRDVWIKAAGGTTAPKTLPVPGVRIAKGLPFGIDIGATYFGLPEVDAHVIGGELRWAIVDGGLVTPALGLRLSATELKGVPQLGLRTGAVDLMVSKGFPFVTPFAGIGSVRTRTTAHGVATLAPERRNATRVFGGAHLNFGLLDLTFEGERLGDVSTGSIRLGFRF